VKAAAPAAVAAAESGPARLSAPPWSPWPASSKPWVAPWPAPWPPWSGVVTPPRTYPAPCLPW